MEYSRVLSTPTGLKGCPSSSSQPAMPGPHSATSVQIFTYRQVSGRDQTSVEPCHYISQTRVSASSYQEVFSIRARLVSGLRGQNLEVELKAGVGVHHGTALRHKDIISAKHVFNLSN